MAEPTQGQRLAAVQYRSHREIDRVYGPMAVAVRDAVLRHAAPDARGIDRLPPSARAAILTEVGAIVDRARPELQRIVLAARAEAERVAQLGAEPLARDAVAGLIAAGEIWRGLGTDRPSVISQSGALLVRGVAANLPARQIARWLADYFSPWFSTYRAADGTLLHDGRIGAIGRWPGQAGMASQQARLVMLWHTGRAHTETMRRLAIREDQLLRYHVSHKHLESDECDIWERRDVGFGSGLYPPDDFPRVPRHGRCRCWAERADRPRFLTTSESVPA